MNLRDASRLQFRTMELRNVFFSETSITLKPLFGKLDEKNPKEDVKAAFEKHKARSAG